MITTGLLGRRSTSVFFGGVTTGRLDGISTVPAGSTGASGRVTGAGGPSWSASSFQASFMSASISSRLAFTRVVSP